MLIFAGIATSLIVCAVIDTYMENKRKQKNEQAWIAYNRAMAMARHRHPNGVGTWTHK